MPIELGTTNAICTKCGKEYSRRKGYFPVSYAILHKGIGYIPVCRDCIDQMYNNYLSQCNNAADAVRQVCRKLDLYWSDNVYTKVEKKATTRSMMTEYIYKINTSTYVGKSYDDTLLEDGTMWSFSCNTVDPGVNGVSSGVEGALPNDNPNGIDSKVVAFWGRGYTASMYNDLEQRREYWMSRLPSGATLDIGTEAIIRQICSLELDINRDRVAGRSVDKNVNALNALLGSASLKPVQKKSSEDDSSLMSTPLGVWLYRYENKKPLPEIDDNLKDVNGTKKYIFTWMGHLCKMLGIKNGYTKMYEEEISRLRVERPEYNDEDDEILLEESFSNTIDNDDCEGNLS